MTSILITAIGGDIAQAVATIIRQAFPEWRIVGVDMDLKHGGSLFVDKFCLAPSANSPGYIGWLENFVLENRIDLCLPMSEAELSVLAVAGIDRVGGAKLLWAGPKVVLIGCDKLLTTEFIRSVGIPYPWTLAATQDVSPPAFPCIFKLRKSAGSKAVFVCGSIEDVRFFRGRYPESVIQEYLSDESQEITCAVYRTRSGKVGVLQMQRRLVEGKTGWARIVDYPEVARQCNLVAQALDLTGAINIQLRMTPAGPRIFEINPRLSSSVLMRHLAGFTDVVWLLSEAIDINVQLTFPKTGMVLARTQGAAIVATPAAGQLVEEQN